jgi:hypothetical protein
MAIEQWWGTLPAATKEWLTDNNGDAVPPPIVAEIAAVGGPSETDSWWVHEDGADVLFLPDDAVDWIEAVANGEEGDEAGSGA